MGIDIHGVNSRDERAWKALFDYYYAPLCCYVNEYLNDNAMSEDTVQEVFMKIWNSDLHFDDERHLNYYMYKAVYNNGISKCRVHHTTIGLNEQLVENWPDDDFASTVKEEMVRRLYEEIVKLPEQRRRIIMLSIEGKSGKEIADTLGISVNTVKVSKAKAIATLRKTTNNSPLLIFLLMLGFH